MNWPKLRLPWTISFASFINALSIPVIAGILIWVLHRVLDPDAWCSAQAELTSKTSMQELLRCGQILLAQLKTGHWVSLGLVGALALSHLVSVIREAKASVELATKWGSFKAGGDKAAEMAAAAGAKHVEQAAQEATAEVTGEPAPVTKPGELP